MGSCIEASCRRVWDKPAISTGRVWDKPALTMGRIWDKPEVTTARLWERPEIKTARLWERPVITFSKVCSISTKFYLEIPMEHIWLTPDNAFSEDVAVYANVVWTIE